MENQLKEQLEELASRCYEDLEIPKNKLVKFFEENSHNFPILIGDRKVWIHLLDDGDEIIFGQESTSMDGKYYENIGCETKYIKF